MKLKGTLIPVMHPINKEWTAEIEISCEDLARQLTASEIEDVLVCSGFSKKPEPKPEQIELLTEINCMKGCREGTIIISNKINEIINQLNHLSRGKG